MKNWLSDKLNKTNTIQLAIFKTTTFNKKVCCKLWFLIKSLIFM